MTNLPIYAPKENRDAVLSAICEPLERLGMGDTQISRANPGAFRTLAFSRPAWASDYCLVSLETTPDNMVAAIECVLGLREDRRMTTMATWLSKTMGREVIELEPERREYSVKFE